MRLIATLWLATAALAFALPRALADEQVTPNAVVKALEEDYAISLSRQKRRESGAGRPAAADHGIDAIGYQRRRVLHCLLRAGRSGALLDWRVECRRETMLYQSGSCCNAPIRKDAHK